MTRVRGSSGPVDLAGGVQPLEHYLVQTLPHLSLLPFSESSPARHTGPKAELARQIAPRDPGVQHEQDPVQRSSIVQALAPRIAPATLDHRQQRLNCSPQPIIDLKP
jgi:hypothetical protein